MRQYSRRRRAQIERGGLWLLGGMGCVALLTLILVWPEPADRPAATGAPPGKAATDGRMAATASKTGSTSHDGSALDQNDGQSETAVPAPELELEQNPTQQSEPVDAPGRGSANEAVAPTANEAAAPVAPSANEAIRPAADVKPATPAKRAQPNTGDRTATGAAGESSSANADGDSSSANAAGNSGSVKAAGHSSTASAADPNAATTTPAAESTRASAPTASSAPAATSAPASAPAARGLDRSPAKKKERLARFGGTRTTEDAVDASLEWLAAHQQPDGTWDRERFRERCPRGAECGQTPTARLNVDLAPGLTGLVLLAFLGAGHDGREEPYVATVRSALDALLQAQQPHGGFGAEAAMAGYNDSLATFALAEYCALTQDQRVLPALRRAVARLVESQQELGGWDYTRSPTTGRNDTSITAWAVQALQAAAAAGVELPAGVLAEASLHFVRAAREDGQVWYADAGTGFKLDENMQATFRYGPAMAACGLLCEQLLGWRQDATLPTVQERFLLADLPSATRAQGRDPTQLHSEYYWYYGTAAMFQRGGDAWTRWNSKLRDALLPMQKREKNGDVKPHNYGCFPAYGSRWGKWGRMGGSVYTTALAVLTLEIYYRETPAFLREELAVSARDWRRLLEQAGERRRRAAIDCLAQLRVEIAEPVLIDLLDGHDREAALAAAEVLTRFDSPLGLATIAEALPARPPVERAVLERAVRRGRTALERLAKSGSVRVYDADARLATIELPGAWAALEVRIERGGRAIGQMRIIQRHANSAVLVAERIDAGESPFQTDDAVTPILANGEK